MKLKRTLRLAGLAIVSFAAGVAGLIAYPDPLFAYESSGAKVRVLSDKPIDEAGARAMMADVEGRLNRSPLPLGAGPYTLFVATDFWWRRLLFTYQYDAGGVAYYPLARKHAFLSGADFARDRLISPSGTVINPPRTLGYYGTHELAHVLTGERVGGIQIHLLANWIKEGLADYCALGSPGDLRAFDQVLGRAPITVEQMKRYGVYPRYRMLVTYFLDEKKWPLDKLFRENMSEDAALAAFRGDVPE